ncbi:hypothetical protein [Gorillibacterium sp. sgz500922]|uniref:hypothetical protein n=1 Tax=Gorillibacterium sp. sgz500922 TaxID=3446694 RepID=UPI003F67958A
MNKRFFSACATVLLTIGLIIPPVNTYADAPDTTLTKRISLDQAVNPNEQTAKQDLQTFLAQDGATLVFTGADIDKVSLYNTYLKKLKVPLFYDKHEMDQLKGELTKEVSPDLSESKNSGESVTTAVALYNYKGMLFVMENNEGIGPDGSSLAKSSESLLNQQIESFKADMQKTYAGQADKASLNSVQPLAGGAPTILTTIRVNYDVNGTYKNGVGTSVSYKAGKATTDYIVYREDDADANYDYLIISASSQIWPAGVADGNNLVLTNALKSNLRKSASSDSLLSWSPDTTGLNLNSGTQYSFSIGYPWAVNFGFTWAGSSSTKMNSTGDKNTGLATCFIYRTSNSSAIATKAFTLNNSIEIKSSGKQLVAYASIQFGNSDFYHPDNRDWFSSSSQYLFWNY